MKNFDLDKWLKVLVENRTLDENIELLYLLKTDIEDGNKDKMLMHAIVKLAVSTQVLMSKDYHFEFEKMKSY